MVTIYLSQSCNSSKRAINWFNRNNISFQAQRISQISREDIVLALSMTDDGLKSIVKCQGHTNTIKKISSLNTMNFNEAISYIKTHTEILRTPIIISKNKILIGYNDADIRQFIPQYKRRLKNI